MKHLSALFALFLLSGLPVAAQTIVIPLTHNIVTIDGHLDASEWMHSGQVSIPVNGSDSVQVLYHHDSTALYLSFTGKLESANMLFPEILTDALYQQSAAWTTGQWWLHVSATDCEHDGAYGVYNNCQTVQPGWQAGPNFAAGAPYTDTVEVRLPFSKIGYNWASDTIGLSFVVTNTATIFKLWPAAADRNVPSSWGKAVFSKTATVSVPGMSHGSGFRFYPNPATDRLILENLVPGSSISISDFQGRQVLHGVSAGQREDLFLKHLAAGPYLLHIRHSAGRSDSFLFLKS